MPPTVDLTPSKIIEKEAEAKRKLRLLQGEDSKFWDGLKQETDEINRKLEKEESSEIQTFTTEELLSTEFPPVRYLVRNLISSRGFTAITGAPFSYKSFLSLYFCVCIASGKKVFDNFEVEQGAVLIIDKENQLVTIQERLNMLGVEPKSPIFFLKMPDEYNLWNKEVMQWTINFCIENQVKLILFDSFIHIHKGNENDSDSIRSTFTLLKQLSCAKMFITHHRKPTRFDVGTVLDRIRGSSDIGAELENHIALDIFQDKIKITQGKNRGGILIKPFLIKPIIIDHSATFEYEGEITEEISKIELAGNMIMNHFQTEFTRQEAMQTFEEVGRNTIDEALKKLVKRELLTTELKGKIRIYVPSLSPSLLGNDEISPLEQSYLIDAE